MNDIFRTVRELLENRDCVLMGNAVNTEGKLYDDSVENLTAILAMQDSHKDLLAALTDAVAALADANYYPSELNRLQAVIAKAKGN